MLTPALASPPNTVVASTTELSQAVAQVAEAVREVKVSASQRVRVCDHLARRLGVYDGKACRHACPSDELYADFAQLTPCGRRVQKALCYKAPHKLADGSVTLELQPGTPDYDTWSECCRVYCVLLLSLGPQGDPSTRSQEGSGRVTSSVGELPGSLT